MTSLEGLPLTLSLYGFAPGYLVYLLFVFLPGLGVGELLGIWKIVDTLTERLALAFGLGVSVASVVFLVKTSGMEGLRGISVTDVYATIIAGFIAFVLSVAARRRVQFPTKPRRTDYSVFGLMIVVALMLVVYFDKYPIFPEYFNVDPSNHVKLVLGLISGTQTSVPYGILYFGVHYQLAAGVLLVGGKPLIVLQRVMAILVILSPLVIYYAAKSLTSNDAAALVTSIFYSLSGMIWYAGVFDSGLYPNFYGIISALFIVAVLIQFQRQPSSVSNWILLAFATINGYMSHYTFLTVLPALLVIPIMHFASRRNISDLRRYLFPPLAVILPTVIPTMAFPSLVSRVLFLAEQGGGAQVASTTLSNMLSSFPFFSYLAVELENDIALIIMLALLVFCIFSIVRTRAWIMFIPIVWFFALLLTAPFNISAWRYSYEAIVPLTLAGAYGLYLVLPRSMRGEKAGKSLARRIKSRSSAELPFLFAFVILFGAVLVGSWGQVMVADALTQTATVSNTQNQVYNAINWLKSNTPNGSQYLSVSDWRFTYSDTFIGRSTYYAYEPTPTTAISAAGNISASYIIVTYFITLKLPSGQSNLFPWNNFPSSTTTALKLVYNTSDVRIFKII